MLEQCVIEISRAIRYALGSNARTARLASLLIVGAAMWRWMGSTSARLPA